MVKNPLANAGGVRDVGLILWRRKWQPTPVFLPGESRGQRSLVGYSPQGHTETDTTEATQHTHTYILCCCSVPKQCPAVCDPMATLQSPLSSISQNLLKFMFIESVTISEHLIPFRPLLVLSSVFPSIRVFSNESTLCIRWPKYWSMGLGR